MDIDDLNEFLAENLYELAWRKNYPLVPTIGVDCFLQAMDESGFIVDKRCRPFRIFDSFDHQGRVWTTSAPMSEQEIVSGWNQRPRASPGAIYDSIYATIDKMQEQIKGDFPEWRVPYDLNNALFNDRSDKGHSALRRMEANLKEYFSRYQEGALARVGGSDPQLHSPLILPSLIERDLISLDRINQALSEFGEGCFTSVWDTIEFLKNGRWPGNLGMAISGGKIEDYIWGTYLLELARLKNYPVKDYESDKTGISVLETACDIGWSILDRVR